MTEDGFLKKFRFSKPDGSEMFVQFSTSLDSYLERWIQLSKTNRTFEDLNDLFLREEFKRLALFFNGKIWASIHDMTRYTDQFAEVRTTTSSSITQNRFSTEDKQTQYKYTVQQNQSSNGVKFRVWKIWP